MLGTAPVVTPSGSTVYVATKGPSGAIYALGTSDGAVVGTIGSGGIDRHAALSTRTGYLYASTPSSGLAASAQRRREHRVHRGTVARPGTSTRRPSGPTAPSTPRTATRSLRPRAPRARSSGPSPRHPRERAQQPRDRPERRRLRHNGPAGPGDAAGVRVRGSALSQSLYQRLRPNPIHDGSEPPKLRGMVPESTVLDRAPPSARKLIPPRRKSAPRRPSHQIDVDDQKPRATKPRSTSGPEVAGSETDATAAPAR